jgi:hypothetical protein
MSKKALTKKEKGKKKGSVVAVEKKGKEWIRTRRSRRQRSRRASFLQG